MEKKHVLLLLSFCLLLTACAGEYGSTQVQPITMEHETCSFTDGNITIEGCSAVKQYQDRLDVIATAKANQVRYNFNINCLMEGEQPFQQGIPVRVQLRCTPETW